MEQNVCPLDCLNILIPRSRNAEDHDHLQSVSIEYGHMRSGPHCDNRRPLRLNMTSQIGFQRGWTVATYILFLTGQS